MQMIRRISYGILTFGLCLLNTRIQPVNAQTNLNSIFLSEINWGGSNLSTADEWLELVNTGMEAVDLSGWLIVGAASGGGSIAIGQGTVIGPGATLLVSNYDAGNAKSTLTTQAQLVTTSVSLSNSDLNILLARPDGMVVDSVVDEGALEYGNSNPHFSMERDLEKMTWKTAEQSINLTDNGQFGTPGVVIIPDMSQIEANATESEPEQMIVESDKPVEDTTEQESDQSTLANVNTDTQTIIVDGSETVIDSGESSPLTEDLITTIEDDGGAIVIDGSDTVSESTSGDLVSDLEDLEKVADENSLEAAKSFLENDLTINEIVSDPNDGIEWVEIKNNLNETVDLADWTLVDASGRTTHLDGKIEPNSYSVIDNPSGNLNNSGDTISLYDPSGKQISVLTYGTNEIPAPADGMSLARTENGGWQITKPTKGAGNEFEEEKTNEQSTEENYVQEEQSDDWESEQSTGTGEEYYYQVGGSVEDYVSEATEDEPATSAVTQVVVTVGTEEASSDTDDASSTQSYSHPISTGQVVNQKDGARVMVRGTVTATAGTFGKQVAYLDGLELYLHSSDWPTMAVGDQVEVRGTVDKKELYTRVKLKTGEDVRVLSSGNSLVATGINRGLVAGDFALLVTGEGVLESVAGKIAVLRLDNNDLLEVMSSLASGSLTQAKKGDRIAVTGVVRLGPKDGLVVALRSASDWKNLTPIIAESNPTSESVTDTSDRGTKILGGSLLTSGAGAVAYWFIRAKRIELLGV